MSSRVCIATPWMWAAQYIRILHRGFADRQRLTGGNVGVQRNVEMRVWVLDAVRSWWSAGSQHHKRRAPTLDLDRQPGTVIRDNRKAPMRHTHLRNPDPTPTESI
jgi:hypothetical protein